MKSLAWLALSLLLGSPLHAADGIGDGGEQALRNLLRQDCGSCHGLTLQGGLGPALLPRNLDGRSAEYLTAVILHGRPGTAMPPWRGLLTPAEARWIADRLLEGNPQ